MYRKSNKKKKRRPRSGDGRNKENIIEDAPPTGKEADKEDDKKPCYEIKTSEIMGRYLVAARDLRAGELIIEEQALAVGPCAGCGLVCLGCYRDLDETCWDKCPSCSWPVCSAECSGVGHVTGHTSRECSLLKDIPPPTDVDELKDCYHAIMPLRCLLLKENPAAWKVILSMESHDSLRRARGDIYPLNEKMVVSRLRGWGLPYQDEEVHTICGVLEVNAFEVGVSGAARALYGRASLLAHACTPSSAHTDLRAAVLRVRAAVPHRKGDIITLSYAYTLQATLKRRSHILHSKFFRCVCERCRDPTELGTRAGAFRCPRCAGAVLPPSECHVTEHVTECDVTEHVTECDVTEHVTECDVTEHVTEPWRCECGYEMREHQVHLLLNRLTDEYESIDANDVRGFESFLHKYRNVLYPTHYLFLFCKHSLSQLYGKVTDYMIQDMPLSELNRKVEICRDLMTVFDVIEPGYSRLRGITLYELHAPLMILTTREFEKKTISKDELRRRLKEIVGYLTEAALILGFEPPQSSEGLMAAAARDALTKIKTWEKIIGKIS